MVVVGVITLIVVIFISANRGDTSISFLVFTARAALWVALTLAASGGFLAGFLTGRRRYKT